MASHAVVSLSNQNLALSQTMSSVAKKAGQSFGKLRVKAGQVEADGEPKLTPSAQPKLDTALE